MVRTAYNCTRDPVAHAWISCFGVHGVGVQHTWVVTVGGRATSPSLATTSFLPPQPSSISGSGAIHANTDGGQVLTIVGMDLGPKEEAALNKPLVRVVYGPLAQPALYTAQACEVVDAGPDGSVLQCISAPGTGGDLYWTVTVGNQTADNQVGPTSYGWPVIASFAGLPARSGATEGLETVMIFGSNFGPLGTPLTATYSAPVAVRSVVVGAGALDTGIPEPAVFRAQGCVVVEAHKQINCSTVPGAGSNIVWQLTINGLTSQSPVRTTTPTHP